MFGGTLSLLRLKYVPNGLKSPIYTQELYTAFTKSIDAQPDCGFTSGYLCNAYHLQHDDVQSVIQALLDDGAIFKMPGTPPLYITAKAKDRLLNAVKEMGSNGLVLGLATGIIGSDEEDECEACGQCAGCQEGDDDDDCGKSTETRFESIYDDDSGIYTLRFAVSYDPTNLVMAKKVTEIEMLIKEVIALQHLLN